MNNDVKNLKFDFDYPLNKNDSEVQTYGCRHSNPDICKNCYIPNVCAFASDNHICKKPSIKWKKIFNDLKKKEEGTK